MIVDLITAYRATLNEDPKYNVQLKSKYPIKKDAYKPGFGEDSIEVFKRDMIVTVTFIDDSTVSIVCDRMIEEFDKLVMIQNFEQIAYELKNIKEIVVE